jgi:hypothetical protein
MPCVEDIDLLWDNLFEGDDEKPNLCNLRVSTFWKEIFNRMHNAVEQMVELTNMLT